MKLKNIFYLAIKNFLNGKIRTFFTITAAGVGFGILFILISFGLGIEKITLEQISSGSSMKVFDAYTGEGELETINDATIKKIREIPEIKKVEPSMTLSGELYYGPISKEVSVQGVNSNYLNIDKINISDSVDGQELIGNTVYISSGMLIFLGIEKKEIIGHKIDILILNDPTLSSDATENDSKKVRDISVSGIFEEESPVIYINKDELKKYFKIVNYNNLRIEAVSEDQVKNAVRRIEKIGLTTYYKGDAIGKINSIFFIFSLILGSFGAIALFVAIIGILNTLTVSLIERTKEIGLLKTFGIKTRQIFYLLLFESMIINFAGAISGIVFAIMAQIMLNSIYNYYADLYHGYRVALFYNPVWLFLGTISLSVVVALISGIYPALRASKISILSAFKYE